MCRKATAAIVTLCALAAAAYAQPAGAGPNPALAWRRVGNGVLALDLAGRAGGPVDRVWFSAEGGIIYARTPSGHIWQTRDLEHWTASNATEPPATNAGAAVLPESGARSAAALARGSRMYAAAQNVWRSDDGGLTWSGTTAFQGRSILGGPVRDIAVSPLNADEIVVAADTGVWRSIDGGDSWSGLNEMLPNLPARRLVDVGDDSSEVRFATASGAEFVWTSGERTGWRAAADSLLAREASLRAAAAQATAAEVTSAARVGDQVYAGAADGRIFTSSDRGHTWRPSNTAAGGAPITRIVTDTRDPLYAVAITASRQRGRVLRTINGGVLWDDISGSLPAASVNGVAADRLTGAVYIASSSGLYMSYGDAWSSLRDGAALDVMLDAAGNQLYAIFEDTGVFARLAPHRARDPRIVSAGDRILRAAAPGSLLSVIGARVEAARVGAVAAPVLDANTSESQVQLPFDLTGTGIIVQMDSSAGRLQVGLPLASASPSIFVDRDGNPLVMNADSGLMLDAAAPARSNSRIQILATGLGRVAPSWPTGLAAPLQDPPKVIAPVRAYLDREPLEVISASLAPGYIGFYLVEVRLPQVVNRGTAELYVEAADQSSNRVRIYLEP